MTENAASAPIVVTGGAGAIGSVLVARLLREGRAVHVLDNFSSGRRDALPTTDRLTVTPCDLGAGEPPAAAFTPDTELWHLAANADARRGASEPTVDVTNGTLATHHVLERARRSDVKRVLFSSSSTVYGLPTVQPTPESYGPLEPESLYGAAKLAAEGLVCAYAHTYGLTTYIFRFANIVDGRMRHGVVYDFFEKLRREPTRLEVLGDGRQAKSYLRTEACVDGMLTAARKAAAPVNLYNLGSVDRTSVREIAEKVVAAHGGTARIEFTGGDRGWLGDVPQQLLAIDRIRSLGWSPGLTSSQAVDRTIVELLAARQSTTEGG